MFVCVSERRSERKGKNTDTRHSLVLEEGPQTFSIVLRLNIKLVDSGLDFIRTKNFILHHIQTILKTYETLHLKTPLKTEFKRKWIYDGVESTGYTSSTLLLLSKMLRCFSFHQLRRAVIKSAWGAVFFFHDFYLEAKRKKSRCLKTLVSNSGFTSCRLLHLTRPG